MLDILRVDPDKELGLKLEGNVEVDDLRVRGEEEIEEIDATLELDIACVDDRELG